MELSLFAFHDTAKSHEAMKLIMNDMIRSRADYLMRFACYHTFAYDESWPDNGAYHFTLQCRHCAKRITEEQWIDYAEVLESSVTAC